MLVAMFCTGMQQSPINNIQNMTDLNLSHPNCLTMFCGSKFYEEHLELNFASIKLALRLSGHS